MRIALELLRDIQGMVFFLHYLPSTNTCLSHLGIVGLSNVLSKYKVHR